MEDAGCATRLDLYRHQTVRLTEDLDCSTVDPILSKDCLTWCLIAPAAMMTEATRSQGITSWT